MNKTAIRNFAIWAKTKLEKDITDKDIEDIKSSLKDRAKNAGSNIKDKAKNRAKNAANKAKEKGYTLRDSFEDIKEKSNKPIKIIQQWLI